MCTYLPQDHLMNQLCKTSNYAATPQTFVFVQAHWRRTRSWPTGSTSFSTLPSLTHSVVASAHHLHQCCQHPLWHQIFDVNYQSWENYHHWLNNYSGLLLVLLNRRRRKWYIYFVVYSIYHQVLWWHWHHQHTPAISSIFSMTLTQIGCRSSTMTNHNY